MTREAVRLPQLANGVETATVLEWACEAGQVVAEGDPLLSVELDKVDADVSAPLPGRVVELLVQPGDEVAVGTAVCILET